MFMAQDQKAVGPLTRGGADFVVVNKVQTPLLRGFTEDEAAAVERVLDALRLAEDALHSAASEVIEHGLPIPIGAMRFTSRAVSGYVSIVARLEKASAVMVALEDYDKRVPVTQRDAGYRG
jgi:hypothetical protein